MAAHKPLDAGEIALSILNKLNITANGVMRYGYGGLLVFIISWLYDRQTILQLHEQIGPLTFSLITILIGVGVYCIYRVTLLAICEWFFYGVQCFFCVLQRRIMWLAEWQRLPLKLRNVLAWFANSRITRSKTDVIRDRTGLRFPDSREAYAVLRDLTLAGKPGDIFHRQHSELHVVYMTAFVCGTAWLLDLFDLIGPQKNKGFHPFLGWVAAICCVGAMLYDRRVMVREGLHLVVLLDESLDSSSLMNSESLNQLADALRKGSARFEENRKTSSGDNQQSDPEQH